jgi:futalosine hydrolase
VGDVVIATSEAYSDTGSSSPAGWLSAAELGLAIARPGDAELGGVFPLDLALAEAARAAIAAGGSSSSAGGSGESVLLLGRCITSSCVTGRADEAEAGARRWGPLAESMEGAAAAHISALYGVPFLEIRGISNLVTNRDRESWQVERAIAVAGRAAIAVVGALDQLPLGLG